jgi:Tfp pilus assembly protein PilO
MDKLTQWVALTIVAALAIVAGGWFLLISPKKSEAEALRAEAAAQLTANTQLETELKVLQAQAADLPSKQADIARISALIPDNPSLPSLVRALTAAGTSAGIDFVSIAPGAPELVAPPVPVAPVAPAPAAAQTTPAAAPAPASPAGQLSRIPVSLNVAGAYYDTAQFLANLEALPRALRLSDVAIAPGLPPSTTGASTTGTAASDGRSLVTTLTGSVFMAVNRPAPAAAVAPVAAPAN